MDVSIETCPHYLFFTDEDVERLGAVAKCAPPLRAAADQQALWDALAAGHVDIVGSDHSPTTPAHEGRRLLRRLGRHRRRADHAAGAARRAGATTAGCRSSASRRCWPATPARRFRIAGKGSLAVGNDADLALVDPDEPHTLRATDLHQRHKISPYLGATFRGRVRRTLRRGETIFLDGTITAHGGGRLVRPASRS